MIEEFLKVLQDQNKIHNLKFIYVAELGSRAYNTNTKYSNYNLKGIYIAKEENYLSVLRPPQQLKQIKEDIQQCEKQFGVNIDYEFVDIRKFLQGKILKNNGTRDPKNLWFSHPMIYINTIPKEMFNIIETSIIPPYISKHGQLLGFQQKFPKQKQINLKDLVICSITMLQYIVMKFFNQFSQSDLQKLFGQINKLISEVEVKENEFQSIKPLIESNIKYLTQLCEQRKQQGNVELEVTEIQPDLFNLLKLLTPKNQQKEQVVVEEIEEAQAEHIFHYLLNQRKQE